MYKTTRHAKPYLYRSVQYRYLSTVFVQLASLINMVVDVVQNPQKSNEYEYEKKNMYVTPRCAAAAAAVVSALVLRRPTKEYTHPYSMMHRGLPTAGIQVVPHYHQLLVYNWQQRQEFGRCSWWLKVVVVGVVLDGVGWCFLCCYVC